MAVVNYDEARQYPHAQPLAPPPQLEYDAGEILPGEAPPPYEEIQWTVRVRQPRRRPYTQG